MTYRRKENGNNLPTQSQFLLYQTEDGQTCIEVRLQDETVWLSQAAITELFQSTKRNIRLHLKNIFAKVSWKQIELSRNTWQLLQTAENTLHIIIAPTGGYRISPAIYRWEF